MKRPVLKSNNTRIKLIISGNAYHHLMEEVEELIEEICTNRSGPNHKKVDMRDRRAGCISDVAFGFLLARLDIPWKKPTNFKGQTRNPYNNSDYGDYEIDGEVYDVKGSGKHKNVSFKYNHQHKRWKKQISYLIGSHVIEHEESVEIHYYGILPYEEADDYDCKPHVPVTVIEPKSFKDFKFDYKSPIYITK